MANALANTADEIIIRAIINFINAQIENRNSSEIVTADIPVDETRAIHVVVQMSNFENINVVRSADDLAIVYRQAEDTYYITTRLPKGMDEANTVSLVNLDVAHHDYARAQQDVDLYGLNPIHFMRVRKGETVTPFGVKIISDVDLPGLNYQTHAVAAALNYAEMLLSNDVPVENWILLRALFANNPSFTRRLVEYDRPGWLADILRYNPQYAMNIYAGASRKDKANLKPYMDALGIDTRHIDLIEKLYLKTAELGNRLAIRIFGQDKRRSRNGRGYRNLNRGQVIEMVEPANSEKPTIKEIEGMLAELRDALDDLHGQAGVAQPVLDTYRRAVEMLVRAKFRINGDTVHIQRPHDTTLEALVWGKMGNEAKLSSFQSFQDAGVAGDLAEEIDTSKVSTERLAKAAETLESSLSQLDLLGPIMDAGYLVLVVDTSSSMDWAVNLYRLLEQALESKKKYTLITFGNNRVTVSFNQFKHNISLRTLGDTPLVPAMSAAYAIASRHKDSLVVLLSDLEGNNEHPQFINAIPELGENIPTKAPDTLTGIRTLIISDKQENHWCYRQFTQRFPTALKTSVYIGDQMRQLSFREFLQRVYNALNQVTKITYYVDIPSKTLFINKA